MPFDAVIGWEEPILFADDEIMARQEKAVRGVEMQVAHFSPYSHPEQIDEDACLYFALSHYHGNLLIEQGAPKEHIRVLPNGINFSKYEDVSRYQSYMDEYFYSSSPDRGLIHLLECWPEIKRQIPSAKVRVCYGVTDWAEREKWSHNLGGDMCLRILEGMDQDGVIDNGRTPQKELAEIQMRSGLCLYPADTVQPTETGCITLIEASAAYTPAVTTDCDCLEDEFSEVHEIVPLPLDHDQYVDKIVELSTNQQRYKELQEKGREFAKTRDWGVLAKRWIQTFEEEKP